MNVGRSTSVDEKKRSENETKGGGEEDGGKKERETDRAAGLLLEQCRGGEPEDETLMGDGG